MMNRQLSKKNVLAFIRHLEDEGRSIGTVQKYQRDMLSLMTWLGKKPVSKQSITAWRAHLVESGLKPATVNAMLAAANSFFTFAGWDECRVKYLKIQRQLFRSELKELTRSEYEKLLDTARRLGRTRLVLLMETICATGIRVSEVNYITVEAAEKRRAEITLKGKTRVILIPGKLCKKLLKFAKSKKIASGNIFITRSGSTLSRKQIWAEMKAICKHAGITQTKVFPHNLRHLFARAFYRVSKDIVKLADVLGHSNMETTRIYLVSTGAEHAKHIEGLGLIC